MKFRWYQRSLSLLIALVMLVQLVPGQCFATETDVFVDNTDNDGIILEESTNDTTVPPAQSEPARVVGEDPSKRGESYKEFILDNGLRLATVYPAPVHYETADGVWVEIDNTLVASVSGGVSGYRNAAGDWQVHFPGTLSGTNGISVTKDGYTVSFGMSGELRSTGDLVVASIGSQVSTQSNAQLETDAVQLTPSVVRNSVAQIQTVDVSAQKAQAQYPETVPDKLHSRVEYPTVYAGTSVRYDLSGQTLKESVILSAYDSSLWGYRYRLDTGTLVPTLMEDRNIELCDPTTGEPVLYMPAPFLLDDDGAWCGDVEVVLTQNGDSYLLSYYLPREWLADTDRAWPVVLDPVVEADTTQSNIRDVSVYQQNTDRLSSPINTIGALDVGYNSTFGKMRAYLKYDELPGLTSADVIVQAVVQLHSYEDYTATPRIIEAHAVNGTWASEDLTWATADTLGYGPVVDYQTITGLRYYAWDITDITRGWYEGENTGVMFKAQDSVEATTSTTAYRTRFVSSDYAEDFAQPTLMIVFRNNSGLESYWDYTTVSAGRAGTGYINDYTGNLVWIREDMGYGGNRMPVSISHIYNANDITSNSKTRAFGMSTGWRTNFNQLVYHWDEDGSFGDYYVWEDADGTSHYFYHDDTMEDGEYKDEDGLKLTLKVGSFTDPVAGQYQIIDEDGNTSYFDSKGRLIRVSNNQQTKSHIDLTYLSENALKISTITDGVGRKYTFTYSGGLLSTLRYYGTGDTVLRTICYYYTNSLLTSIRDPDLKYSYFRYADNGLLSEVEDLDGYKITFGYNTVALGKPNRITSVAENDGGTTGRTLTLSYGKNSTTFRDQSGNVQIKQFNNWGNTLSVQDDQGRAQYAQYANNDPQAGTDKSNQLTLASKLQSTVSNLICDPSFEDEEGWGTTGTSDVSFSNAEGVAYLGEKSMKVTNASASSGSGVRYGNSVEQGATYTFSAYVKTGTASAYLALTDGATTVKSQTLAVGSDWVRLQVSITTTGTNLFANVLSEDAGTFYVDCAQLEKAVTASRFNLVSNGDFGYLLDWTGIQRVDHTTSAAPQLNSYVHQVTGDPSQTRQATQTVQVSGSKDDVFVVAGWAKGYSVPLGEKDGKDRAFGILLEFLDGTTVVSSQTVEFSPCLTDWQYASGVAIADGAYTSVKLTLQYDYNANTAYFDGIQLFKERFGHTYKYEDGKVTSVTDLKNAKTEYEFNTENELVKTTLPNGSVLTYEYDEHHNVKKATTGTGIVYEFKYDVWGNNTEVSINSGDVLMTSTATYTSDGNRLESTTDAAGNITTYSYNAQTNVLEWVQAPKDGETTRTEYTYDNMYRMATAAVTTDTGLDMSAEYTYTDDQLTAIETESTTYGFTYGKFGLRSRVTAGSAVMAMYTYTSGRHDLATFRYGNGDTTAYVYDDLGRVLREDLSENDSEIVTDTVEYQYDNDGGLAKVIDSESGITSTYYYDFIDRLCHYTEEADGYSLSMKYSFNKMDAVTFIEEIVDGSRRSTSITYDADQRVASIRKGSVTESYTYDGYGRVTQKVTTLSGETRLTERYTYRTVNDAPTTQVASHQIISAAREITYSYTYDANGNILSVTESFVSPGTTQTLSTVTSYVYDSQNQLLRENNEAAGKSWTWTYDNAGNILSHGEYAYTTGTLGTAVDTTAYTYGRTGWGDLLTAYDGVQISTDEIGNPLTVGSRNYTWKNGRQLATLTQSGTTWTYTYNADGLRTGRTNGTTTYQYIYADGQLVKQRIGTSTMSFSYDAAGTPLSVYYSGANYYYVTNLQGDVIAITNDAGAAVVSYTYDAWGKILSITGSMAETLGKYNPLRYRGYVYDVETELYYLQSRYYDPEMGRFISPDGYTSTGQGFIGANMFAYCGNCPVPYKDTSGTRYIDALSVDTETTEQRKSALALQKKKVPELLDKKEPEVTPIPEPKPNPAPQLTFVPDPAGNGGEIKNSYLLMDHNKIVEYTEYLFDECDLSRYYSGSQEGFVLEWEIHNFAVVYYSIRGNTDKVDQAKDFHFGKTLFSDDHGLESDVMRHLYWLIYPKQAELDSGM